MAESLAIETERLLVVPFRETHLTERYVGWLNDPEVVRYSDQRFRSHTLDSCREYWQSFQGTPNYFWAVVAKDVKLGHIGTMTGFVDPPHRVVDVGILIGERAVWGRGYGSEAWTAVCHFLLYGVGMRKVSAGTLSVNDRMISIMRRAGMVEDGRRVRHCLFDGQEVDLVYAGLFRGEARGPA